MLASRNAVVVIVMLRIALRVRRPDEAARRLSSPGAAFSCPASRSPNDRMEDFIGLVSPAAAPSVGKRALRWNGIRDAPLRAEPRRRTAALQRLDERRRGAGGARRCGAWPRRTCRCFSAATTQGDYLVPGHASAVHGELGGGPLELGELSVGLRVLADGGEGCRVVGPCGRARTARRPSPASFRRAGFGRTSMRAPRCSMPRGGLRWKPTFCASRCRMAPARSCSSRSRGPDRASLRIEWIDLSSLAGCFDPCMWAGATVGTRPAPDDGLEPCRARRPRMRAGAIALLQDFDAAQAVIRAWVGVYLEKVDAGRIEPDEVDHGCCVTIRRARCAQEIVDAAGDDKRHDPRDKVVLHAAEHTGNIGSASIWVMLDALLEVGPAEARARRFSAWCRKADAPWSAS